MLEEGNCCELVSGWIDDLMIWRRQSRMWCRVIADPYHLLSVSFFLLPSCDAIFLFLNLFLFSFDFLSLGKISWRFEFFYFFYVLDLASWRK